MYSPIKFQSKVEFSLLSCKEAALLMDALVGVQVKHNTWKAAAVVFTFLTSGISKSACMYILLNMKIVLMANCLQWVYVNASPLSHVGMKLGQTAVTLPHLRITPPKVLCPRGV